MNPTILLVLLLLLACITTMGNSADSIPKRTYITQPLQGSITLDGIPSEEAWNAVEWAGGFTQWKPNEGKGPSEQTRFKILYDKPGQWGVSGK